MDSSGTQCHNTLYALSIPANACTTQANTCSHQYSQSHSCFHTPTVVVTLAVVVAAVVMNASCIVFWLVSSQSHSCFHTPTVVVTLAVVVAAVVVNASCIVFWLVSLPDLVVVWLMAMDSCSESLSYAIDAHNHA